MKQGKTDIVELAREIQRRANAAKDMVADTRQVLMVARAENQADLWIASKPYNVRPLAHRQIGERIGIPAKYYDRMLREAPELLCSNVNHWFHESPERRLVRTYEFPESHEVRAFLSDRYRRLDNDDVCNAVAPLILDQSHIQLVSQEVTDSRLYLKALFPRVEAEVRPGDVVQSGFVISNSEIGLGALTVTPLVYRLVCTNGMICEDSKFRRNHVGGRLEVLEGSYEILSDETKTLQDWATLSQIRDIINAAADQKQFEAVVAKLRAATDPATQLASPIRGVEVLTKETSLTQAEGESVLERLLRGGDYTKYGVANAVTNLANDVPDYDRATELEALGGRIIDLPASQWGKIQAAA